MEFLFENQETTQEYKCVIRLTTNIWHDKNGLYLKKI